MGKGKPFNIWMNWPEYIGLILLAIGFFVSISIGSAVILYTLIFLAGFLGGRVWFSIKDTTKVPWTIILIGFLIGFLIGARYGNRMVIIFFYIFGIFLSYYLHDRGIIKSAQM